MRHIHFLLLLFISVPTFVFSQEDADDGMIQTNTEKKEEREGYGKAYLEDQFYAGLTYDYLISDASSVVQQNFSRGLHAGFLRDLPMNERRNVGMAIGLGYSYDLIYSNIFRENSSASYEIVSNLNSANISRNYFETHTVELPIEFRWRTSTAESHKFWRIYSGVKLGYVFGGRNLFKRNDLTVFFKNADLYQQWHFKAYSVFGYNTWNFFIQYNFSPILKNGQTAEGTPLKSSLLQMGLMFYIL